MTCRHEIVGIITAVGANVKDFKVGDRAGVGCLVDSCGKCDQCTEHKEEQFCGKAIQTYNGKNYDGTATQGGYSTHIVVSKRYAEPSSVFLTIPAEWFCSKRVRCINLWKLWIWTTLRLQFVYMRLLTLTHITNKLSTQG